MDKENKVALLVFGIGLFLIVSIAITIIAFSGNQQEAVTIGTQSRTPDIYYQVGKEAEFQEEVKQAIENGVTIFYFLAGEYPDVFGLGEIINIVNMPKMFEKIDSSWQEK